MKCTINRIQEEPNENLDWALIAKMADCCVY